MSTNDPNKLMITTPGVANIPIGAIMEAAAPNATVVKIAGDDFLTELIDTIRRQVKENGTQRVLVINAHGSPLSMNAKSDEVRSNGPSEVSVPDLLKELTKLQSELGVRLTDRLVFYSCDVLTDLSPKDVAFLRAAAKGLGTEIAGATTDWWANSWTQEAEVARFGTDGSVGRDVLNPSGLKAVKAKVDMGYMGLRNYLFGGRTTSHSDVWFDCHAGHSQEEGAARQMKLRLDHYRATEARSEVAVIGGEVTLQDSPIPERFQLSSIGPEVWMGIIKQVGEDVRLKPALDTMLALKLSIMRPSATLDAAAVEALQKFVLGLTPDERKVVERAVDAHLAELSTVPQQRPDSRDAGSLKDYQVPDNGREEARSGMRPQLLPYAP